MTSSYDFTPGIVRKSRRLYDFTPIIIAKRPKEYSQAMRDRAEAKGHTMPGGGFPIESVADLNRAKHAVGRAKNPAAARRWINSRAEDLGAAPLGGDVGKFLFQKDWAQWDAEHQGQGPGRGGTSQTQAERERWRAAGGGLGKPGARPPGLGRRLAVLGGMAGLAAAPFATKAALNLLRKQLQAVFLKADPDLTDGRSGGISHSESDRVGVSDNRTPEEKNSQLLDLYDTAYKNPPMPGEDHDTWMDRVWGAPAHLRMFADQLHQLHAIYHRARKLPDHTYAIAKVDILKYAGPDLKGSTVWGWASVIEKDGETIRDHQGDQITEAELIKAAHDYVTNSRTGGAMHIYCEGDKRQPLKCGEVVESLVFTKDLQTAMGINLGKVGWLLGYRITNPAVRKAGADGQLKSFSIGGAGLRIPIEE